MRKTISVITVLTVCFALFAADLRSLSMGDTGIAFMGTKSFEFVNPANVSAYSQDSKLIGSVNLGLVSADKLNETDAELSAQFNGKNIAAKLSVFSDSFRREDSAAFSKWDMYRTVQADVSLSRKWSFFSAGLGIRVSSQSERNAVKIYKDRPFQDFAKQQLFGDYSRVDSSDYVRINAGCTAGNDIFSFGMLADNLFTYKNGESFFSWKDILKNISFGFKYGTDPFSNRGELRIVTFNINAELRNIFGKSRELRTGGELSLQLKRDLVASARFGIKEALSSDSKGCITAGFGARIENYDISLCMVFPGKSNQKEVQLGFAVLL